MVVSISDVTDVTWAGRGGFAWLVHFVKYTCDVAASSVYNIGKVFVEFHIPLDVLIISILNN